MAWIESIYDRTLWDVNEKTAKGYLNIEDLNRIENNTKELADLLVIPSNVIIWDHSSLPTWAQFERILQNLQRIKQSRDVGMDLPENPINTYEKVNQIEEFLEKTYRNYLVAADMSIRCGEGYCGADNIL